MTRETVLLILASATFAVGGLCMKLSAGLTRPSWSLLVFVLFCGGAAIQAFAMRRAELGVAYIFVLGGEAVITLLLSVIALGENCPPSRIGAITLIVGGMAWLHRT